MYRCQGPTNTEPLFSDLDLKGHTMAGVEVIAVQYLLY